MYSSTSGFPNLENVSAFICRVIFTTRRIAHNNAESTVRSLLPRKHHAAP